MERARDDRDWWLCWIGVDPRWDSLRGNSRFRKMLPARETRKAQKRTRLYAGSLAAVLLLAVFGWWVTRSKPVPFATARISKLTSNGTAENAAISPDARTAVFSAQDANGTSIWRKSLENGAVESLSTQLSEKVGDIDFTDGGSSVDFVTYPLKNPANRRLFKAPVTGGPVRQIGAAFPGPVSLSLDGHQVAYYGSNLAKGADELQSWDLQSGKRTTVTSYRYPTRFAWNAKPAWSWDGKKIAYATEERDKAGFLVRLYAIDAATHVRHLVASTSLAVGAEHSMDARWFGADSCGPGARVIISTDLVCALSVSERRQSSRRQRSRRLFRGQLNGARVGDCFCPINHPLKRVCREGERLAHPLQVTAGSGRYFDLCWTSDAHILYASDATGSADLWVMNANGSGQRQILAGAGRNYAPTASPDSRAIAFHSNRSGNWQVWRADPDGSRPKQLSETLGTATGRSSLRMESQSCFIERARMALSISGEFQPMAARPFKSPRL